MSDDVWKYLIDHAFSTDVITAVFTGVTSIVVSVGASIFVNMRGSKKTIEEVKKDIKENAETTQKVVKANTRKVVRATKSATVHARQSRQDSKESSAKIDENTSRLDEVIVNTASGSKNGEKMKIEMEELRQRLRKYEDNND